MAFCESWVYEIVPQCWNPVLSDGMICDECWKKVNENGLKRMDLSALNENSKKTEKGLRMGVQQFTATLMGASRQKNSVNGNPIWNVHTSIGDMKTEPDAQIGHRIGSLINLHGPDCLLGRDVVFTVFRHRNGQRWVTDIQPAISSNRL